MRTFAQRYNIAINDPDLKALYRMEQDALHEEASRLWSAEKRGEKRGEKLGVNAEKRRNAKSMKLEGITVDVISRVTGLPVSEISNL